MLVAQDIGARYGTTQALRDVSVEIAAGELVAVVGRSGSGKSTLLHCLAGVVRPEVGSVTFDGERIDEWTERRRSDWRLRHVGLVLQFGDLVPELTLVENVRLPLQLAGCGHRQVSERTGSVLDRLEITDVADRRPGQVSGGQMQRAAIARALVHRPAVVLADEPTGALDTTTGQLVMEALIGAAQEQASAVVLVTHEARLSSYCDREITLEDGSVAAPVMAPR
ncbi:MAG: ABC transporter ATP-binding protein [Acidimicrobiales bacterium]